MAHKCFNCGGAFDGRSHYCSDRCTKEVEAARKAKLADLTGRIAGTVAVITKVAIKLDPETERATYPEAEQGSPAIVFLSEETGEAVGHYSLGRRDLTVYDFSRISHPAVAFRLPEARKFEAANGYTGR